jgi:3D (Asp-Asp-Asp) domain-containing protein
MRATAYTPINTRMEGGRYTKTERDGRSAHGVAVDRDLIPLGTRLWIPGYGHGIADDIGGRIQGHRVDVRMQKRGNMHDWGVRRVRVYVLQEPKTGRTRRR